MGIVKTISTDEAEALLDEEVPVLDVRTQDEFSDGHIPSAINIPFKLKQGDADPNPDFVEIVDALFAKDQELIIACQAGARSKAACLLLQAEGFTHLHDLTAGFGGKKDAFGRLVPGWTQEGREVETYADPEQTYEGVKELVADRRARDPQ